MLFSSAVFLGFFAVVYAVYWALTRHRVRMVWLLLCSCAFYMSWSPWCILLLLGSTSVDYLVALRLHQASPRRRRWLLALSIGVNLGLLAFFKYTLFALQTSHALLGLFGIDWAPPAWRIVLPLGISFYTFEAISYVVDVYRGKIPAIRHPLDYALYILFFPHLLAGPIVRSGDFVPQLSQPKRFSWPRLQLGVQFFLMGLFKKSVLADNVGTLIDPVFADVASYSTAALWLALLGYAVQIYGDFSGYSDMAVGLAHLLGFKLPANFLSPYLATSMSEVWKRWHVSLSSWLRDYLFFPLGGSRHGTWITCRNLMLTFVLCGLWHGASWNYLAWGAYTGLLLVAERLFPLPASWRGPVGRACTVPTTFLAFCFGLVFVRTTSLADAATMFRGLLMPTGGLGLSQGVSLAVAVALAAVFLEQALARFRGLWRLGWRIPAPLAGATLAAVVTLCLFLRPDSSRVFIYFQY